MNIAVENGLIAQMTQGQGGILTEAARPAYLARVPVSPAFTQQELRAHGD